MSRSLAQVLAPLAALAMSACSVSRLEVGMDPWEGGMDRRAEILVRAATANAFRNEELEKRDAALGELLAIAKLTPRQGIGGDVLKPLLMCEQLRSEDYQIVVALILSAGGPELDKEVLSNLKQLLAYDGKRAAGWKTAVLALALAAHPCTEVTQDLAVLASAQEATSQRRGLLGLALAAREDKTRDWMAEVARNALGPPQEGEFDEYTEYLVFLCYTGLVLRASPALVDNLWLAVQRSILSEGGRLFRDGQLALAAYAILASKEHAGARSAELKMLVEHLRDSEDRAVGRMGLARLGIDKESNLKEGLRFYSVFCFEHGDGVLASLIPHALATDDMMDDVCEALSARSPQVRLGAVLFASQLGAALRYDQRFDAQLRRLLADPERAVQRVAEDAIRRVTGLPADGGSVGDMGAVSGH